MGVNILFSYMYVFSHFGVFSCFCSCSFVNASNFFPREKKEKGKKKSKTNAAHLWYHNSIVADSVGGLVPVMRSLQLTDVRQLV